MQKTYNLFLDDIRQPFQCTHYRTKHMPLDLSMYAQDDWVIVRDYDEFVKTVQLKLYEGMVPERVSFDHDLAEIHYDPSTWKENFQYKEKTGADCAKWFVGFCIENDIEMPETWVHSMNPIGADRIKSLLEDWHKYKERFAK